MIKLITKFYSFNKTSVYFDGDYLIRRSGIFFVKRIGLYKIVKIYCVNRDAITHDEIMINFSTYDGKNFYISEFDVGFIDVMNGLSSRFVGLIDFSSLHFDGAFSSSTIILWKK